MSVGQYFTTRRLCCCAQHGWLPLCSVFANSGSIWFAISSFSSLSFPSPQLNWDPKQREIQTISRDVPDHRTHALNTSLRVCTSVSSMSPLLLYSGECLSSKIGSWKFFGIVKTTVLLLPRDYEKYGPSSFFIILV